MRAFLVLLLLLASCRVSYVVSSSYYQMELLAKRKKNTKVLKKNLLPPEKADKLRLIPELKEYGKKLGLSSTDNYDTISLRWDRTIWNVSGCDPLEFTPASWRFPIVGRVTYLGFFTDRAADRWLNRLKKKNLDVYKRSAGAYSTLGWFRDPVLPGMLEWDEDELAETVFHELAHATLWVKGSVNFNESFANFVGTQAMFIYLSEKYGPASKEYLDAKRDYRDQDRFVLILHNLYKDLDAVYQDSSLSDEQKLQKKQELFGSLEARIMASDMEQKERYAKAIKRGTWNNAKLIQFKTYNTSAEDFMALFEKNNNDLKAFIDEVGTLTKKQKKPFEVMKKAAKEYRATHPAPASQPTSAPASQAASLPSTQP